MKGLVWGIAVVVALLAFGTVGGGYLIGGTLDERIEQAIQEADAETDSLVLTLQEHERGTLSSSATVRVYLAGDIGSEYRDQVGKPFAFELPVEIEHGPLIWEAAGPRFALAQIKGPLRLSDETIAGIEQASGEEVQWEVPLDGSPADLTALIGFDGEIDARIDLHDFAGTLLRGDHEDLELELGGVEGVYRASYGGSERVESFIAGDVFAYELYPDSGKLLDFSLGADMHAHDSGLWPGRLQASFARLELAAEQSAEHLRGEEFELAIDDFTFLYGLNIHSAEDGGDEYGELIIESRTGQSSLREGDEHFRLQAGNLDGVFSNITLESLIAAQQLAQQLEQMSDYQIDREMQALATDFLNAGPRLQINEFTLYGDRGKVGLDGFIELAEQQAGGLDPFALIAGLQTEFQLVAHKDELLSAIEVIDGDAAAEQFRMALDEAAQMGYVDEEDDNLSTKVAFADGQLKINGESADELLEALIMEALVN
ncbi:DUF945 family protein [Halorhodospira halochloris]|uniref:DUF945 family protein n=1 Tax=Halorhodospira halochloris TaxID=1052 RepID=UPI001EE91B05|nr:DUF945 family protein [Halorhodospira halochloris]MCG5547577.1 YdgA family protein [Halorhodospira halochloris]